MWICVAAQRTLRGGGGADMHPGHIRGVGSYLGKGFLTWLFKASTVLLHYIFISRVLTETQELFFFWLLMLLFWELFYVTKAHLCQQ